VTDPQPAARAATQPGDAVQPNDTAEPNDIAQPNGTAQPWSTAQPEQQPDDVVASIAAATAWLGDAERSDTELPLTELAERLTALHGHLQGALSELDRT
jgi:hypothetical protein